jgi:transposase InsO family protein
MSTTVHHKLERLVFSGKPDDFAYFQEQFESRMYLLKLSDSLLDQCTSRSDAARDEKRYRVWCELIQCLDRKCVMFIRSYKPNGTAAWKALVQHFKSSERPRIHATMTKLTSIRMAQGETITDYLTRAEDLQMDLKEVGEEVSDSMFVAMVLKGLPHEYDAIITLLNYGEKKTFDELKQDLINFANTKSGGETRNAGAFHSHTKQAMKCHGCGKMGHKQADCRSGPRRETRNCHNCGRPGHFAKDCRTTRKCDKCGRTNHATAQCWGSRPTGSANHQRASGHLATSSTADDQHQLFSFASFPRTATTGIELLIDSGCTGYMLTDRQLFADLDTSFRGTVGNADASQTSIAGRGTARFWAKDQDGHDREVELRDAMYVPEYSRNLVSVKRLCDGGATIDFGRHARLVTANGTNFPFVVRDNLYSLQVRTSTRGQQDAAEFAMTSQTLTRWHERLGHNNKQDVAALQKKVEGMKVTQDDEQTCNPCVVQKAKRAPMKKTWGTRSQATLDIVHSDILGPLHEESIDGFRYAIGFIDSFSRYGTVYLMKTRDECFSKLQQFVADVGKPRTLATDGAKEYTSDQFNTFCREQGIRHELSAPYTPEENGKAERIWGTVVGMSRCMMDTAGTPKNFWSYALKAAFYLKNRCLHAALGATPFEVMFACQPDLSNLRIFGCIAYVYVERDRKKLDDRARPCVFLGYDTHSKTYIVGTPDSFGCLKATISRSVTFAEDTFYFKQQQEVPSSDLSNNLPSVLQAVINPGPEVPFHDPDDADYGDFGNSGGTGHEQLDPPLPAAPILEQLAVVEQPTADNTTARQSGRTRAAPARFNDYVMGDGLEHLSLHGYGCSATDTPSSAKQAMAVPHWKAAMEIEYGSLQKQDVWELVPRPTDRDVITGKWHFVVNLDANGAVLKHKARFVARGFTQIYGQDYTETYSPTTRLSTIRILMACAASARATVHQMDIKTAYLNAQLDEEIFMDQPQGFVRHDANGNQLVCKLKKSLYGLKQSGRNWYRCLTEKLQTINFQPSAHDKCLFIRKHASGTIDYAAVWVDDIIYYSTDPNFHNSFERDISSTFTIGDCGPLNWFLGMKIESSTGSIAVSQQANIDALLLKFGMQDCKGASTPLAEKALLSSQDSPVVGSSNQREMQKLDYRGLVGSINYLANTSRPDLSFAAHSLSSFLNNPGYPHWLAAKHVLRYLKTTSHYKLWYGDTATTLNGYSDSDFAGNLDTRRSTSGYCFRLGNGAAISWSSKRQGAVATSTTEAEVYAASEAIKEATYLQGVLGDMGIPTATTTLHIDNQAAIALSKDTANNGKAKHYSTRVEFIRDEVKKKNIQPQYISTDNNAADLLTKGLGKNKTQRFVQELLGGKRGY